MSKNMLCIMYVGVSKPIRFRAKYWFEVAVIQAVTTCMLHHICDGDGL